MTVEVINTRHLKITFDKPSTWTLYASRSGGTIDLNLHWNNNERANSTMTLFEGTQEYSTFKEFFL